MKKMWLLYLLVLGLFTSCISQAQTSILGVKNKYGNFVGLNLRLQYLISGHVAGKVLAIDPTTGAIIEVVQSGSGGAYVLPKATVSVIGGVRPDGTTVFIDPTTGIISVAPAVGGEPVITATNLAMGYWNRYKKFVAFNTDSIGEGAANKWFTAARVSAITTPLYRLYVTHENIDSIVGVNMTGMINGDLLRYNGTALVRFTPNYLTVAPTYTASGDLGGSSSGLGFPLSINTGAVSNAKMANMAAGTVKANLGGSATAPSDVTIAALKIAEGTNNLDNTSDLNKPPSTAVIALLANKADTVDQTFTGKFVAPRTGNAVLQTDTIPKFSFGGGTGIAGDTAWVDATAICGSLFQDGTDTAKITKMVIVLQGTSPTLNIDIKYGATLNSGGTSLVSGGTTSTNTTIGTIVTSFTNSSIPPGNFIWCKISGIVIGSKPIYLNVTLLGTQTRKG